MKSERALLLDLNAAGKASKVCAALAPILAPSFTVDVPVLAKQKVAEYFGDFNAALDKLINPVLIFIAFSSGLSQNNKQPEYRDPDAAAIYSATLGKDNLRDRFQ